MSHEYRVDQIQRFRVWQGRFFSLFFLSTVAVGQPLEEPLEEPSAKDRPVPQIVESLTGAHHLYMAGKYEEAMAAYRLLAGDPTDTPAGRVPAELGIARCYFRTGEYAKASEFLHLMDAAKNAEWHYLSGLLFQVAGAYDKVLFHARQAAKLDPRHAQARLLLAQMLETAGRPGEALQAYHWFDQQLLSQPELPRDAEWVTATAIGFLRYSVITQTNVVSRTKHVLHEMLQTAYERIDRTSWPARIAAADLLREKYNNDSDDGCLADYRAALRINANLCEAHVGLGEVALQDWKFEVVEVHATAALDTNPNFPPAIHLLAKNHILERRYDEAAEKCRRALEINPNDLVALSLKAAAAACRFDDKEVAGLERRVSAINPRCAVFHQILGDALSGIRQYAASELRFQKAIEFDPTNANVHTELGMMYMQWGLEEKARDVLDVAWELDPFNRRTKFTLDLLDSLQRFASHETEHFIIRFDPQKDPEIGPFVANYMESIYEEVTGDFDTTLIDKTLIEIFPTQRSFAVRITGKPWIPTVGACSGRIIALASPRADPALKGPFDLARVLKHEFAHTVTLAATKNRIPHWFTEGLAVLTENAERSFRWWVLIAEAVRREELFTIESINWGFMRPRKPTDRQLAYAQSEMICEYLIERFGYDVLSKMIVWYRDGFTNEEVIRLKLGVETADFDRDVQRWIREEVAKLGFDLTPPEEVASIRTQIEKDGETASLLGRLAKAAWDADDGESAFAAAQRALEADENEPRGLDVAARVYGELLEGQVTDAERSAYEEKLLPILQRLRKVDPDGWTAPKLSSRISLVREDWDQAVEALTLLQRLCPIDPESWKGLAGIYLERGDDDLAVVQLLELARNNVSDADVPAQIAKIYVRKNRLRDSIYWYRRSLFIAPFHVPYRRALGDVYMQVGDTAAALREYIMLTKTEPMRGAHFERAAIAAHKLGDDEAARSFASKAVKLDPDSDVQSLLGP
ncbi:MAG: tetratricopeptide repeat protein [Planctomycetes bacterium]|nr:tetratricopeptide repeat protein [Planctomycetota bacterium]